MFLKVGDQLFNTDNLQYFIYHDNRLNILFNGYVKCDMYQTDEEYLHFLNYIKEDKNIIIFNKYYGSNLKNISGLYQENDIVTFYFSDGSTKKFSHIDFDQFEKLITEE